MHPGYHSRPQVNISPSPGQAKPGRRRARRPAARGKTGGRLRWDLNQLHTALNEQRQERGLAWSELAQELGCTPSRLTNLRTARMADMGLTMRVTQWLGKPAAEFIHAAHW